jgi:hypothetical protein
MTQELITELREWRIASAPYEPEYKVPPSDLHLKAADALERMVAELETANRIKTEQIDYAIGLQRAIEAHCREELALEAFVQNAKDDILWLRHEAGNNEYIAQRALLVRARNMLSQPAHWGADDDHIKSRYALCTEISEHIAGEKK